MELIIYSKLNTVSTRNVLKTINVSIYGGIIYFSKPVVKELKLEIGDKILVAQQKDNEKNWLIRKADLSDETAFELKDDQGTMLFRCTNLARTILSKFGSPNSMKFLVEKEPVLIGGAKYTKLIPVIPNQGGVKKLNKK